ncbi:MAG: hypothetical protein M1822_002630 [Bathelium mastoideum]|nr:MAG: hypothetical protein M1822_002630 [Bathelium mastoideum]
MRVTTISVLSLTALSSVAALPSPIRKSVSPRVDFSASSNEEYKSVIVEGYVPTALSYLEPKQDAGDAYKKALTNPSQSYND